MDIADSLFNLDRNCGEFVERGRGRWANILYLLLYIIAGPLKTMI